MSKGLSFITKQGLIAYNKMINRNEWGKSKCISIGINSWRALDIASVLLFIFNFFKKEEKISIIAPDFLHILNFDLYLDSTASRPPTMNWFRYLYTSPFDSGLLFLHIALIII